MNVIPLEDPPLDDLQRDLEQKLARAQRAVTDRWDRYAARTPVVRLSLDPRVNPYRLTPLDGPSPARGSNASTPSENAAMVETQVTDHPPLQVCHPGHRPRMYRAAGNSSVVFYVECPLCGVQSPKMTTQGAAADRWARRDVITIPMLMAMQAVG